MTGVHPRSVAFGILVAAISLLVPVDLVSQRSSPGAPRGPLAPLDQDRGAAGAWQTLRKLTTTASLMHTTAHPDDEHGGMLTRASRGDGARVSLLSLTRGEAGDNAIGPELFDALGLIRTEELLAAGRYYGLDALYFSTAADYGYSKRLDEALEIWGRETLVGDVVRAIRIERPLVVVSRFQGNARDGHGQHQAAGVVTREAFDAAGDPRRFPEQIASGLTPWQPRKLYIGGVREDEAWSVRIDEGAYSPVLGESFQTFSRIGLSLQRSQNGGRLAVGAGPSYRYYRRIDVGARDGSREDGFFDGLDVEWSGVFAWDPQPAPDGSRAAVELAARHVAEALDAFDLERPSLAAPALIEALNATRRAREPLSVHPEASRLLAVKEQQIEAAVAACLSLELDAVAMPGDVVAGTSPPAFGPPPTMGPVVAGQRFHVQARLVNRSPVAIEPVELILRAPEGWRVTSETVPARALRDNDLLAHTFTALVADDARPIRPYFRRSSIAESLYEIRDSTWRQRPFRDPVASVLARYRVNGVPLELTTPVSRWESQVPYGYVRRELTVVPALALNVTPRQAILPLRTGGSVEIQAELLNNRPSGLEGEVRLELPAGWSSEPDRHAFRFEQAAERRVVRWIVRPGDTGGPGGMDERSHRIAAVAIAGGREYREGYQVVAHRDLETRLLYRDAEAVVRGIDVTVAPDLRVGYVMGIGDAVPAAVEQLGATVELLDDAQLATADLGRFDAIMTGTRAYAVRPSLKAQSSRLMAYVEAGGNLIVLYNTAELVPDSDAPYPAELPLRAEEVSEENAPVTILQPDHPLVRRPNRITAADFEGWVEQRGSKFFSRWDPRYVAMIEAHDVGQDPQRGGWLTTRYGDGYYTYFAYALHRQLPYGVPGAYRLLANLLSLGAE